MADLRFSKRRAEKRVGSTPTSSTNRKRSFLMKKKNEEIINEMERSAKAKWIPIRDLEQEGYAEEYIVFLLKKKEWINIKKMIRDL